MTSNIPNPPPRRLQHDRFALALGVTFVVLLLVAGGLFMRVDRERRDFMEQSRKWTQGAAEPVKTSLEISEAVARLSREQDRLAVRSLNIAYGFGGALLVVFALAVLHAQYRWRRCEADAADRDELTEKLRGADLKYRSIFDNAIEGYSKPLQKADS